MFTKEFKLAAVRWLEQGISIGEIARALEVNANVLHRLLAMRMNRTDHNSRLYYWSNRRLKIKSELSIVPRPLHFGYAFAHELGLSGQS